MNTYIVCSDLNSQYDQDEFIKTIHALGDSQQVLSNVWIVVTEKNAKQIRDELSALMTATERLIVIKSGTAGAWKNVLSDNNWLVEHL